MSLIKLVVTGILIAADVGPTNYFYDLCNNFSSFEEGSYRIQISRDHWTMSNSININIVDPPIVNSIAPWIASSLRSTDVLIKGSNFQTTSSAKFGDYKLGSNEYNVSWTLDQITGDWIL